MRTLGRQVAMLVLLAGLAISPVHAGFRSPWNDGEKEKGMYVGWVSLRSAHPTNYEL